MALSHLFLCYLGLTPPDAASEEIHISNSLKIRLEGGDSNFNELEMLANGGIGES